MFFVVLVAAALLTTVDPWYRALVHPRPWLGLAFFGFSLFAGLNVALPLVGVPPAAAVRAERRPRRPRADADVLPPRGRWGPAAARAGVAALLAVGAAWIARPAVPPAPVSLVRPTLARAVRRSRAGRARGAGLPGELRAWGGLTAFTPVAAPAALHQPIEHRWRHEGRVVSTVRAPTPVQGGRAGGFRTFSRKADFPPDARGAGRWTW